MAIVVEGAEYRAAVILTRMAESSPKQITYSSDQVDHIIPKHHSALI